MENIKNTNEEIISNDSVTDIDIKYLIPNVIDDFIISIYEGHHTLFIPMNTTGTQFKVWRKKIGGVFSKDVLNYSYKKTHGKYVLIKSETLNCIARIISEDEELKFKTMKLIDGKIKDRSYMILKKIDNSEKISNIQRYINEKDMESDESLYIPNVIKKTIQDDDFEHHSGSISLFSE